jgi:hypothetical protein
MTEIKKSSFSLLFVDDEDKFDEWLNELENSKQLGLK